MSKRNTSKILIIVPHGVRIQVSRIAGTYEDTFIDFQKQNENLQPT